VSSWHANPLRRDRACNSTKTSSQLLSLDDSRNLCCRLSARGDGPGGFRGTIFGCNATRVQTAVVVEALDRPTGLQPLPVPVGKTGEVGIGAAVVGSGEAEVGTGAAVVGSGEAEVGTGQQW
jgi:hypothetical protein